MSSSVVRQSAPATADDNNPSAQNLRRRASILVVDDEAGIRNFLQRALAKEYGLVEVADSAEAAEELRQRYQFDLFIVDIRLPGRSGLEWVQELRQQGNDTDVIFITAYADLTATIGALRSGATDFLLKPFRLEQIMTAITRCFEHRLLARENLALRRQVNDFAGRLYGTAGILGRSVVMQTLCDMIKRVAPTPSSILIEGETGTGKELAANAIHHFSGRSGAFVPVNCAAVSPELFESELFGHTKGAFTGAHQSREGLFSFAAGGTLFLDEISEMPLTLQAKLLRVLENRRIRPVGSDREVTVDVRLIVATNRHLEEAVKDGTFREDLHYRLNVVTIHMPALRDHAEDIPDMVQFYVERLAMELGVKPFSLSQQDVLRLQDYHWPGNVRELRNLIERALLLGRFPWDALTGKSADTEAARPDEPETSSDVTLERIEKQHMLRILDATGGNKSEAARRLGISRKTMERKLRSWPDGV
jgi:DNA-binding NtrC family response regulator